MRMSFFSPFFFFYNIHTSQSTATYCLKVTLCFYDEQGGPHCWRLGPGKDFNCLLFLILIIWEGICSLKLWWWQHATSIALPTPIFLLDSWRRKVLFFHGSACVCLFVIRGSGCFVQSCAGQLISNWLYQSVKMCPSTILYTYTLIHTHPHTGQISGLWAALLCISGGTWSYQ